ncbi:hypothetical protein J2S25_000437 [Mesobacillus stamsii]|uniref:Secreted protein n=1 Tax=Mesobacillus stamsii TaxID=225347 RepID=A0ABU0FSD0_9BACI|nr:hypothetical protein [Mesobacillus stamsii]
MVGAFLDGSYWPFFFELLFAFSAEICPNLALIRTTFHLFLQNLSELGSSSDYFPSFPAKPVRTRLLFGLLSAFSHKTCPKLTLVRTTFRFFRRNLSEVGPCSDYFSSFPAKPVRSYPCSTVLAGRLRNLRKTI